MLHRQLTWQYQECCNLLTHIEKFRKTAEHETKNGQSTKIMKNHLYNKGIEKGLLRFKPCGDKEFKR